MSKEMEIILKEGAKEVGVSLNQQMIQMFLVYLKELKEWNQKVNLTSLKEDETIIVRHFIDSLSLVPYLPKKGSLLDLGSGAGFPGIPVKIVRPSLKVTLLEATRKKVSFQRHLIRALGLSQIHVIQGRAERLKTSSALTPSFDIVTSRALSKLEKFLVLGEPFVKKGGYLVAMKGRQAEEELKASREVIKALSLAINRKVELQLPILKGKRHLIFIEKM
ncbi:MAG: 16S rRNA (guanine(527)-N(7))-methyltransferase RsmG [Deltaproteobacteria bacterium]|nr:16S rRNA (guanine(527)-N(7))-methyltransferase RsmG [Deltaproteobacteria bacterium]